MQFMHEVLENTNTKHSPNWSGVRDECDKVAIPFIIHTFIQSIYMNFYLAVSVNDPND